MIETSVSAKKNLSARECRASNILFFKLKKKKNQPNLASENKSANKCVSERKVEKAQKTATISQSREREKKGHRERAKRERTVTHCEPVLSESDKPPRERECYLVTS